MAGPIGSAIADVVLRIPSAAIAMTLGLVIVGGLAILITLDLTALAVGEDLARRAHYLFYPLPQSRSLALGGRLLLVVGACVGSDLLGSGLVGALGGRLAHGAGVGTASPLPLVPLAIALPGLLLFLAGVTAIAAVLGREPTGALSAGVVGGVFAGGLGVYLLLEHRLHLVYPAALAATGAAALAIAAIEIGRRPD